MKVLPISYSNYHTPAFEGRKKENNNNNSHRHISNTLKSVPLATILAMSALNNADAQNVLKSPEYRGKIREEVYTSPLTNAKEKAFTYIDNNFVSADKKREVDDCKAEVSFIDNNLDDVPDEVMIFYNDTDTIAGKIIKCEIGLMPTTLKVVNVTEKDKKGAVTDRYKEYYINGGYVNNETIKTLDGKLVKETEEVKKNFDMQVTPQFYKKISDTMGNKLKHITVDENRAKFSLTDIILDSYEFYNPGY